jgi:hypothetical protein
MHECRIRTSTRKPILRLLYFALAMLMLMHSDVDVDAQRC